MQRVEELSNDLLVLPMLETAVAKNCNVHVQLPDAKIYVSHSWGGICTGDQRCKKNEEKWNDAACNVEAENWMVRGFGQYLAF